MHPWRLSKWWTAHCSRCRGLSRSSPHLSCPDVAGAPSEQANAICETRSAEDAKSRSTEQQRGIRRDARTRQWSRVSAVASCRVGRRRWCVFPPRACSCRGDTRVSSVRGKMLPFGVRRGVRGGSPRPRPVAPHVRGVSHLSGPCRAVPVRVPTAAPRARCTRVSGAARGPGNARRHAERFYVFVCDVLPEMPPPSAVFRIIIQIWLFVFI